MSRNQTVKRIDNPGSKTRMQVITWHIYSQTILNHIREATKHTEKTMVQHKPAVRSYSLSENDIKKHV